MARAALADCYGGYGPGKGRFRQDIETKGQAQPRRSAAEQDLSGSLRG